jgi:Uma2 family endonuclease
VDNLFSAKQQRLLVEPLYSSWTGPADGSPFLADANVGIFHTLKEPPLVPDMFLSLKVQVAADWWQKRHRSYFYREFGKPPEVVIEIVSNREGEEDGSKLLDYARMRIRYYIIFDPLEELQEGVLRVYELHQGAYVLKTTRWLAKVGLGVTLWTGTFEGKPEVWLRWCGKDGQVIPTGAERAALADLRVQQELQEKELALSHLKQERRQRKQERRQKEQALSQLEQERHQLEQALSQLEQERLHKERLMARLRALGVEPTIE